MIARRLAALAVTVALIAGAYVVRTQVFDDDGAAEGSTDDGRPAADAGRLVCGDEFGDVCRRIDGAGMGVAVEIGTAGATFDELTATAAETVPMWLTVAPFPEMVDQVRSTSRLPALEFSTTTLASAPLVIVARSGDVATITDTCGPAPIDLRCLGDLDQLDPTFSPISTATGSIAVAATLAAFDPTIDDANLDLLTWAGELKDAGAPSLSADTAIATIQTRPTFAIAVGAEAELAETQRGRFEVLAVDPAVTLSVQLAVASDTDVPDGLVDGLRDQLTAEGWAPATAPPTSTPDPTIVLAGRAFWARL